MTKKELVQKTLEGDIQEIVPASFSIHFGNDYKYGEEAIR